MRSVAEVFLPFFIVGKSLGCIVTVGYFREISKKIVLVGCPSSLGVNRCGYFPDRVVLRVGYGAVRVNNLGQMPGCIVGIVFDYSLHAGVGRLVLGAADAVAFGVVRECRGQAQSVGRSCDMSLVVVGEFDIDTDSVDNSGYPALAVIGIRNRIAGGICGIGDTSCIVIVYNELRHAKGGY